MSVLIILVGSILVCILLIWLDSYVYSHTKPKHTLESIEKRLEELSRNIEAGIEKGDAVQSDMDIWDYWDSERERVLKWNKRHPHETV